VELNTFLRGFQLIAQGIKEAEDAFIEYDTALLRTQFFLQEFGNAMPLGQLTEFTRQISLATGETQTHIASLEGYLARFRASGAEIERATQVIINASQATGVPIERLGHLIERARAGHARGLWDELGIQVKGLEGQLYSLNQIINIVDEHTRGFSSQFGDTLPAALKKTQAAFEDMQIAFGQLLSPAVLGIARFMQEVFEGWALAARALAGALGIALPALQGAGAAAGAAGGGINRTEEYLRQITFNTGPQGPLGTALRGGGSYSEPGGGLRIRDFNTQFRHVR
jgi:hypothetical protein